MVEVEADGDETGLTRNEVVTLSGRGIGRPDGAVQERAGVQVPGLVGFDALGLEAIGQLDSGRQVGRRPSGGDRHDRGQQQAHREPKADERTETATSERHHGLQRPWLPPLNDPGNNDQPALGVTD